MGTRRKETAPSRSRLSGSDTVGRKGGALLAVLWLAAALSAIAFAVASTVRAEIERASTLSEGTRADYLASGAIDRALLYMLWGPNYWQNWMPDLRFAFPSGDAVVEIIPESSRLSLNQATAEDLTRLLIAIGAPPPRAEGIAQAIVDWRTASGGGFTSFDRHYMSMVPSFRARHASFEHEEEVLLMPGMTPELFHGGYRPGPENSLVPFGGLRDAVSVFGSTGPFDVNTASPALLTSIGIPPQAVAQIIASRPVRTGEQLQAMREIAGRGGARLSQGGGTIYTLRATAWLRLGDGKPSDLRRTISATVKLWRGENGLPYQILRWRSQS